jgi:hypothetical protein
VDGTLADTADRSTVNHRIRTTLITSDWTNVTAKMCTSCGYIMLFGQIRPAANDSRPYNDNNPLDV